IVEDSLGVMRHIFTQTKDSIISNERLFQSRVCGDTAYYDFVKGGEHYKEAYQLLGYMLGACLRSPWDECPLFLNLNPLIYKIILNQCTIPEGFFDVNDLKYYSTAAYNAWVANPNSLGNDGIEGYMADMYQCFKEQLPGIKIFYRSLCDFLNVDGFNILHYFRKSEFLELKHYLEGVEIITYELLSKKLDICDLTVNNGSSDKALYNDLKRKFTTIIKEYPPEKLRKLVFAITAVDTLFVNDSVRICFDRGLNMLLKASTCGRQLMFDKDVFSKMSDHERQKRMKNGLEELMASVDVLTVK
ncbi:MAG: hypothetical protein II393_03450, partial [Cytophagales bacterium]|nr:hypothetical protein [Cytophagales bacterium]